MKKHRSIWIKSTFTPTYQHCQEPWKMLIWIPCASTRQWTLTPVWRSLCNGHPHWCPPWPLPSAGRCDRPLLAATWLPVAGHPQGYGKCSQMVSGWSVLTSSPGRLRHEGSETAHTCMMMISFISLYCTIGCLCREAEPGTTKQPFRKRLLIAFQNR